MPCRMLAPVIEQLGEQYQGRAEVAKVNVDEYPELASRYRIQSIPTVMIFDKGELAEMIVGLNSADVYTKALDKLLGE